MMRRRLHPRPTGKVMEKVVESVVEDILRDAPKPLPVKPVNDAGGGAVSVRDIADEPMDQSPSEASNSTLADEPKPQPNNSSEQSAVLESPAADDASATPVTQLGSMTIGSIPQLHVIVRDIADGENSQSPMVPREADLQESEKASRTSHKRKSDEDSSEKAPSPKEPKKEEEEEEDKQVISLAPHLEFFDPYNSKKNDVRQLMNIILRYRWQSVPSDLQERLMSMPREKVQFFITWLRSRERDLFSFRSGYEEEVVHEPQSDEESDDELIRQEALNPRPAKFTITNEQRLLRCLIFGGVKKVHSGVILPVNSDVATWIAKMIKEGDGERVVEILKDVSVRGRSPRQDFVLYALARCCRSTDMKTKHAAFAAIQEICRIPTHIFELVHNIGCAAASSGWGRGLRKALRIWYNKDAADPMHLAMHVTKYWNRHQWNHRDIIRKAHLKPVNDAIGFIVRYCVKGLKDAEKEFLEDGYLERTNLEKVHKYLRAVKEAKGCQDVGRTVQLIKEHNLVREHLLTQMLNEPEVWAALLPSMPLNALLRNLNKMTIVGMFSKEENVQTVIAKLLNSEAMHKARVHPLKILLAHHTYQQGWGELGRLNWEPVPAIVEGLEKAFYASFDTVEPSNKRIMIALDISSSMNTMLRGYPILIREAAMVMAMVTLRREPQCDIVGFHQKLIPLEMFKDTSKTLEQLTTEVSQLGFGYTDCSKPMIWARKHKKEYDAFIIYTDSETNVHRIPPFLALERYRDQMKIPTAKLIVVGMEGNEFTIARPDDLHMLDVVGFDPDTPEMIRQFLVGGVE